MAQGFNPPHGCEPGGPTFSQGVVQPEGRVVYITGQVAWDENNEVVGPGDARAQMVKCIENIKTVLEVVGGTLDDIVSFTNYFVERLHAFQRDIGHPRIPTKDLHSLNP